ncbi:HigA family addiction module antitoxin [Poritiphilus flavus]|uniref:HigA family addiction module antidote protein n=1 Tax=Poritiphilus flavus TaxID=2697053 RepID=A0A6L9E954_9FLAO|nr:HigA family addiction module antitoxin [Poritiphilus flavus]NAS11132.1 HigA family addiction module antidote protein [Poritiphilus flavus]
MLPRLNKVKGVHPGALLRRELALRNIKGSDLAESVDEHKQTISAILNKRRDINAKLSIKLSKVFKVEKDYFMLLQASYDVKKANESLQRASTKMESFRSVLFWDTDIDRIDWNRNRHSIIKRVLERGNHAEISELISIYGKKTISKEVSKIKGRTLPSLRKNLKKYDLVN